MNTQKTNKLYLWAITSALAGFLFGFDTIVISGAEQKIQQLWSLSSFLHGLAMSSALWGTVLGAFLGSIPTEKWGRRTTLIAIGALYLSSAVFSAIAVNANIFMLARFIGGLGVGVATIASPLYISEISPATHRGRLAGLFQFNIVFGILIAFISNFLIGKYIGGENAWRWMMGIEAVPALIYTIMCFTLPESPRWLISHAKRKEQALEVFSQINPEMTQKELETLVDRVESAARTKTAKKVQGKFFSRGMKTPILLAFFVAFFNQLSGINAILYFAPRIFEWTGLGEQASLLSSIGVGITNFIFTYAGLYLIDRVGRRTLLTIGSFGYIISLASCAIAFHMQGDAYQIVPFCIFFFIAAHAVGQGTVIWVLISEVFPNQFRAKGQSLGSFTHWFFAASLTFVFPIMAEAVNPSYIFAFFCFMMVLQLIWVKKWVPETKGVALEDMTEKLGINLS